MWGRLVARMAARALKNASLPLKERNLITTAVLDALQAVPLVDIVYTDKETQQLIVNGQALDVEKLRILRESARTALGNPALNLVRQQVQYEAFVGAATKAFVPEDMLFYRAAIWWGQVVEKHLQTLAQRDQEPT